MRLFGGVQCDGGRSFWLHEMVLDILSVSVSVRVIFSAASCCCVHVVEEGEDQFNHWKQENKRVLWSALLYRVPPASSHNWEGKGREVGGGVVERCCR